MAAKKKAAESKALALRAREPATYDAVKAIADLASQFGEEVEANVTAENVDAGVEVLARLREAKRQLEALFAAEVAEAKAKIASVTKERDELKKRLERADEAVAGRLVALYRDVDADVRKSMTGRMGSKATFSHRSLTVKVVDADKVPDEFLLPEPTRAERVNIKAVEAVLMNGGSVPGVTYDKNYFLTTRTAEIVQ